MSEGVGKKPREFYFENIEETNEYQQLSNKAPYVRDHSFELVHVIEYSRVEQLEKEKQDLIEALKKTNKIFSSLRSVYGNEWSPQSWNSTLDQMKYNEEILSKLGGADEMRKKE